MARTAGMLANLGVVKGDRVIIYMPMIPEAVIAMLAVARLGAIHSVVFGGFAPPELSVRIDDAKPKVILTASCGIESQARGGIQTDDRPRDGTRQTQTAKLRRFPASASGCNTGRGTRSRLGCIAGQGKSGGLHTRQGQ